MLQTCMNQNLFLYAMIAAGIAGVWCLFWSNHFYSKAIKDLKRLDKPRLKWTGQLLQNVEERKEPIANLGAFLRSQMARGKSAGIGVQALKAGSQNAAAVTFAILAFSILVMYLYEYETYLWVQYAVAGGVIICGLLLLRINFDFSGKEEILLDGWTDYLENGREKQVQSAYAPMSGEKRDRRSKEKRDRQAMDDRSWEPESGSKEEEQISQVREGIRQTAAADSRFSGMLTPEEEKLMREIIREYMK